MLALLAVRNLSGRRGHAVGRRGRRSKRKMNKKIFAVLAAIIIIAGGGLLVTNTNRPQSPTPSDKTNQSKFVKAPFFSLPDYAGKTINLADFTGQNLLINSWAAWCPFCKAELFDFAVAQQEFGDQVTIIAIDRAESKEVAEKFSAETGVNDKLVMLLDPEDSFYRSIGGFSMPETIFVNKEGNIVFHKRGPMDGQEIRERIKQAFSL